MVTADEALAARVNVVEVRVTDSDNMPLPSDSVVPERNIETDPVVVPLAPAGGNAARDYRVTIELLDAQSRRLGTQTISGGYAEGEVREVWVAFDASCEFTHCEDGYRCQEGQCVEYCVEPAPRDETERSMPVACGAPCGESACEGSIDFECTDGYRAINRVCGFGCDDASASCRRATPSNVGDIAPPVEQLRDFVVGENGFTRAVFDTSSGSLTLDRGFAGSEEVVCAPCNATDHGVGFETVDATDAGGAPIPRCGDEPDGAELSYGVFSLRQLHVRAETALVVTGEHPGVFLVEDEVVIDGLVSASATTEAPGPGGCVGGVGELGVSDRSGRGSGGGNPGNVVGGGGASYGTVGGEGGRRNGQMLGGGALPGPCYPGECSSESTLVPLLGGSGGGGTDGGDGGHGGGAIQISTNGFVRFGENGAIVAGGLGGELGRFTGNVVGAAGGGSGGAILVEAGGLLCDDVAADDVVLIAPGGGGGGRDNNGASGSVSAIPAPGGSGFPEGGHGSDVDGLAEHGRSGNGASGMGAVPVGGGGGGGAGRIRVNTSSSGQAQCGSLVHPFSTGVLVPQ